MMLLKKIRAINKQIKNYYMYNKYCVTILQGSTVMAAESVHTYMYIIIIQLCYAILIMITPFCVIMCMMTKKT